MSALPDQLSLATIPNMIGVHGLVLTDDYRRHDWIDGISRAKAAGFDLIEIPLSLPISEASAASTRRALEDHGLVASASFGLTFDTDISSSDRTVAAKGEAYLSEALDVSAILGATHLTGLTYAAFGKYESGPTIEGRTNCIETLRRVSKRAASYNIAVGLEVVNKYECNLLNTAAAATALATEVGAENLVVHLDTYHMNIEERDFWSPVAICGGKLGYVHVGESNRGYLGTGTVDFSTFFKALASAAYGGPITFEAFSAAHPPTDLTGTVAVWRSLWTDPDSLIRHANAFVRAHLLAAYRRQ
jgi:D-psicose/D-tagatose/L-ribulose 3-epimerase